MAGGSDVIILFESPFIVQIILELVVLCHRVKRSNICERVRACSSVGVYIFKFGNLSDHPNF